MALISARPSYETSLFVRLTQWQLCMYCLRSKTVSAQECCNAASIFAHAVSNRSHLANRGFPQGLLPSASTDH